MRIALEIYVNCESSSGAATVEWHILYAPVPVIVTLTPTPSTGAPPPAVRGPPVEHTWNMFIGR